MIARTRVLLLLTLVACGGAAATRAIETGTAGGGSAASVIKIDASRWSFDPANITLNKGEPVVLELTSSDVHHGFNVPGLSLRADILPGQPTTLHVTPKQAGTFLLHCDYYCGSGHEEMTGQIVVK